MSDPTGGDPRDRVRDAAASSLARPLPWGLGALALAGLAGAGTLTALLGATTVYLATVVGGLLAGGPVLPGDPPAALPEAEAGAPAPLPPPLRERYRALHGRVRGMLEAVPSEVRASRFDPEALAGTPEAFREVARALARLRPEDPGRTPLEARLERLEGAVARLHRRWSMLDSGEPDAGNVESLEEAADELEALAEVEVLALPPVRSEE